MAPRIFFILSAWLCIINGMSKMTAYVLKFFSLISDGLGSVCTLSVSISCQKVRWHGKLRKCQVLKLISSRNGKAIIILFPVILVSINIRKYGIALANVKSAWSLVYIHTTYSWNIKWQKCARMGLNWFHIREIFGTQDNWKNENPGSRFGATS